MSKVILSKKTLDVLKNFSTINSSIVFRKGSLQSEQSLMQRTSSQSLLAKKSFLLTSQFMISVSFLAVSLCLTILNWSSHLTILLAFVGGVTSAKYYFSDPEITLKSAPEKNVNFPGADLQFNLTEDDLIALAESICCLQSSRPDLLF